MKILFVNPHENTLYCFRKEFLDELIRLGHEVVLCIESTKRIEDEYKDKVKIVDIKIDLTSKNPFSNLKLKRQYKKVIKEEQPDLIISYKIKPNIYCGLYSKKIPIIANITGLGRMFSSNGLLSKLGIFLYKRSFKNIDYVFFQNESIYKFFYDNEIPINNYRIIPGSGVNISKFTPSPLAKDDKVKFLFASRALEEKGYDLLVNAIPEVVKQNQNVHFNFLVNKDEIYKNDKIKTILDTYKDYITFMDRTNDMRVVYLSNDFLVSPSFYKEGISNILLESLACGRPIITTNDNPGCKEVLQEGVNGYGVISKDLNSLVDTLLKAANTPKTRIKEMGECGRKFVVENFDRNIVIKTYLDVMGPLTSKPKEYGDHKKETVIYYSKRIPAITGFAFLLFVSIFSFTAFFAPNDFSSFNQAFRSSKDDLYEDRIILGLNGAYGDIYYDDSDIKIIQDNGVITYKIGLNDDEHYVTYDDTAITPVESNLLRYSWTKEIYSSSLIQQLYVKYTDEKADFDDDNFNVVVSHTMYLENDGAKKISIYSSFLDEMIECNVVGYFNNDSGTYKKIANMFYEVYDNAVFMNHAVFSHIYDKKGVNYVNTRTELLFNLNSNYIPTMNSVFSNKNWRTSLVRYEQFKPVFSKMDQLMSNGNYFLLATGFVGLGGFIGAFVFAYYRFRNYLKSLVYCCHPYLMVPIWFVAIAICLLIFRGVTSGTIIIQTAFGISITIVVALMLLHIAVYYYFKNKRDKNDS